jgi:hypothetical protein
MRGHGDEAPSHTRLPENEFNSQTGEKNATPALRQLDSPRRSKRFCLILGRGVVTGGVVF